LNLLHGGQLVQHSFASLIFADVFGIQLRSGCFCAGPFGMKLLNLDDLTAQIIEDEVSVGILRDKPGYMRLDLTFYLEPYEIEYIASAIIGVAENSKIMELVYTICNDG
jgi:selenocysteine lyase/cysteine desulfurase